MRGTTISWTDDTWNVSDGCSLVSEGCRNCYAMRMASRFSAPGKPYHGVVNEHGKWNGVVRFRPDRLLVPVGLRKPRRIFVNSMSDLFHEGLTNEQIAAVFGVMATCPRHTFQVLTKRPERRFEWFKWVDQRAREEAICDPDSPWWRVLVCLAEMCREMGAPLRLAPRPHPTQSFIQFDAPHGARGRRLMQGGGGATWPLANVWQGTSCEDQDTANGRIPWLLQTPAAVRFLSMEPLLGHVDIGALNDGSWHDREGADAYNALSGLAYWRNGDTGIGGGPRVDLVIAGCESGPGARGVDISALRHLRNECQAYGVPFFLKQAPAWMAPFVTAGEGSTVKAGSIIELPYLDGVQHKAMPEVPRV